ncbi:hypothetical protein [Mesorhizobium sp. WSM4308]|nr:hypothetical protein [Mesorhizobium sp. WSM4308]
MLGMDKDELLTFVSYLIATAIIIPIGWWLKAHEAFGFGAWVMSWLQ